MHNITSHWSRSTTNENRIPLISDEERAAMQAPHLLSDPAVRATPDHIQRTQTPTPLSDLPLVRTLEDVVGSIGLVIRERQSLAATAEAAGDARMAKRHRYVAQAMSAYHSSQAIEDLSIRDVHLNRIADIIEERAQQFVSENFQHIGNFVDQSAAAVANAFKRTNDKQIKKVIASYLRADIVNLIPGVNMFSLGWQYQADRTRAQAIAQDRSRTT